MRQSIALFARRNRFRATSKIGATAARIEGNEDRPATSLRQRLWSRKTSEVLEGALRNEAPIEWSVLRTFARMPPARDDVRNLLPLLEIKALRNDHRKGISEAAEGLHTVGDLALQADLTSELSLKFLRKWVDALKGSNPFKAIQVWKSLNAEGPDHTELGVSLYLAAGQLKVAEDLASELPLVHRRNIREFISKYAAAGDVDGMQRWINRWQSPLPEDVRWMHHLAHTLGIADQAKLPQPSEPAYFPMTVQKAGPRLQSLVKHINTVLSDESELLENDRIQRLWLAAMSNPILSTLQDLVVATAEEVPRPDTPTWLAILRLVDSLTAISLLRIFGSRISPRGYAIAISRAETAEHLTEILKLIKPEVLYTSVCLSALAQRKPTVFLELIIPPELLETTLSEHHLIALWSADPAEDIQQWLLPLTLAKLSSSRLMRSALLSLARQGNRESAEKLLIEYAVNRKQQLDPRIYQFGAEPKLPKPQRCPETPQISAREQVQAALDALFASNESSKSE